MHQGRGHDWSTFSEICRGRDHQVNPDAEVYAESLRPDWEPPDTL